MCANKATPGAPGKGQIDAHVLSDGSVKATTGDMGGPMHKAADDFMKYLQALLGGAVDEHKSDRGHHHHHDHTHTDDHHHI